MQYHFIALQMTWQLFNYRYQNNNLQSVFPLSRFFSTNQQFVGARANNFWQYSTSKQSFRKFDKFVEK